MTMLNDTWKLINPGDGTEIRPGDPITDFRGEPDVFWLITRAPEGNSSGKIITDRGYELYPSVFNLRIVRRTESAIPDTRFWRHMARGHKNRTGHELTGHLITMDGGITALRRTCCTETPSRKRKREGS
jgi:hypothetical protein